jgi:hypothetical protein
LLVRLTEFDEEAPYILAVPVFDEEAMRAVVGCTRGRLTKTSDEWLDETRDLGVIRPLPRSTRTSAHRTLGQVVVFSCPDSTEDNHAPKTRCARLRA